MESNIETYLEFLKHEMAAEDITSVDRKYIEQTILRAGGKLSEVEDVLRHPSIKIIENGEYGLVGI